MAHGLNELGPSFLRERIVLPIEPLIAELDAARHETAFLELLESRVNRPGLGTPVAGSPRTRTSASPTRAGAAKARRLQSSCLAVWSRSSTHPVSGQSRPGLYA